MEYWIVIIAVVGLAIWRLFRWIDRGNDGDVYTPQDDDSNLSELMPYFTREVVERKVKSLFPEQDHAQILQLLDDHTSDFWGLERTQLDILKLSNGNMKRLQHYLKVADSPTGVMKIVDLAEYPKSSRVNDDKELFRGRHKRLIEKDFREYLSWLKKE